MDNSELSANKFASRCPDRAEKLILNVVCPKNKLRDEKHKPKILPTLGALDPTRDSLVVYDDADEAETLNSNALTEFLYDGIEK